MLFRDPGLLLSGMQVLYYLPSLVLCKPTVIIPPAGGSSAKSCLFIATAQGSSVEVGYLLSKEFGSLRRCGLYSDAPRILRDQTDKVSNAVNSKFPSVHYRRPSGAKAQYSPEGGVV